MKGDKGRAGVEFITLSSENSHRVSAVQRIFVSKPKPYPKYRSLILSSTKYKRISYYPSSSGPQGCAGAYDSKYRSNNLEKVSRLVRVVIYLFLYFLHSNNDTAINIDYKIVEDRC